MNYMERKQDDENFKRNYANFHNVSQVEANAADGIRVYSRGKQADGDWLLQQYGKS